jgi:hypothetical protein
VIKEVLTVLAIMGPAEGLLLATLIWVYQRLLHSPASRRWLFLLPPALVVAELIQAGECILKHYTQFIGNDLSILLLVLLYLLVFCGGCVLMFALPPRDALVLSGIIIVLHVIAEVEILGVSAAALSVLEVR